MSSFTDDQGIGPALAEDGIGLTLRFPINNLLLLLAIGDPGSADGLRAKGAWDLECSISFFSSN